MNQPMRLVELNLRDVYITPCGHRCMLKPRKREIDQYTFVYISRRGEFALSADNVAILRREA